MSNGSCPCNVLNRHMHPEPTDNCHDCCCMCTGYCCPAGVAVLVVALVVAYIVFFILVMKDYPDAWRIVVSIVFIIIVVIMGPMVLWSYYEVIYTRPGYVDKELWRHRPHYRPLLSDLQQVRQQQQQQSGVAPAQNFRPHSSNGSMGSNGPPRELPGTGPIVPMCMQERSPRRGVRGDVPTPFAELEHDGPLDSKASGAGDRANPLLQSSAKGQRRPGAGVNEDVSEAGGADTMRDSDSDKAAFSMSSQERHHSYGHHGHSHSSGHREHGARHPREEAEAAIAVQTDPGEQGGPGSTRRRNNSPYETSANGPAPLIQTQCVEGSSQNPYIVTQLDRWGNMRYCQYCHIYKPDLAYHCGVCKRCVYNFDHHCPYINNCVGRNNYKLFITFLLYSSVACLIAGVLMVIGIFAIDKKEIMSKIGWIAVPLVMILLALALGGFYIEHRCLLAKGKSTVESVVAERMKEEQRRQRGMNPCSSKRKHYDAAQRAKQELHANHPQPTEEEKRLMEALKKAREEEHRRALLGDEKGWRAYYPRPLRVDDSPDGIPRV